MVLGPEQIRRARRRDHNVPNDSDAEDVMQQAYLNAYANLGRFEERSTFLTWLTRIAVNEALARIRPRSIRLADDEEDAFRQIRQFLSYLPSSVDDMAPRGDANDPTFNGAPGDPNGAQEAGQPLYSNGLSPARYASTLFGISTKPSLSVAPSTEGS